jgi:hypothetical protein
MLPVPRSILEFIVKSFFGKTGLIELSDMPVFRNPTWAVHRWHSHSLLLKCTASDSIFIADFRHMG